ncbi:hypothetical protein AB5I41_31335 [Sphingomonas sp. MMS24-JH45]
MLVYYRARPVGRPVPRRDGRQPHDHDDAAFDESGEWMRGTLSIPLSKVDAQGYGSAVTYAAVCSRSVVGVCRG